MHRGVGLLAVVVAAAALLAARPAHGQPAGSVQGTVVDEGGGAPLAAAVVTLEELGLSITTGPDGTFSIDDVPAGNYCLTVTREGFAPLTWPQPGAPPRCGASRESCGDPPREPAATVRRSGITFGRADGRSGTRDVRRSNGDRCERADQRLDVCRYGSPSPSSSNGQHCCGAQPACQPGFSVDYLDDAAYRYTAAAGRGCRRPAGRHHDHDRRGADARTPRCA